MEITILLLMIIALACLCWLFISLALYFVPVIVAYVRKHKDIIPITILTLFLGWTFLGWLCALLWSLNSDTEDGDED